MPGLSPINILADLTFFAEGLGLPTEWKQPQGDPDAGHYSDSHSIAEKIAIPKLIPPWFKNASGTKFGQQSADDIGGKFKDFAYDAIDAVKFSHQMWKLQAKFKDLKVLAVCAIGTPGCLDGPELKSNIKNSPTLAKYAVEKNEKAYAKAVSEGVSEQFKKWQDKVMVPGLPWYPAFAAFPGPMAPPMPNVPMPLIACISAMMAEIIVPSKLGDAMTGKLGSGQKDEDPDKQHEALFKAIGTVLALAFLTWLPSQQVMLVMGKGPIPTFAPPYVPVGPVLGGDNIATPGHLMT